MTIARHIHSEATRLIRRHERNMRWAAEETTRRAERSTRDLPPLEASEPAWWDAAPGFNPYHARRRSSSIGHSIWTRLASGTYEPRPPVEMTREKPGGGTRLLSVFQVADSAVSRMVFESVLRKNAARLSSRAYAYRKDLSAQDAVQFIRSDWKGKVRVLVGEYDFSSFFSSISHDHIRRMIAQQRLHLSSDEKQIIEAFMSVKPLALADYTEADAPKADCGIPQGTSISLILANLAAAELDRRLERLGVSFVRYADDTLMWSDSYAQLGEAVNVLAESAKAMGVEFNQHKSVGISLLVPKEWVHDGEIRTKRSVEFLGYTLGLDHCGLKSDAIDRIKERCQAIVYDNLLREPLRGHQDYGRVGGNVDRDYVRMLRQLRQYLYGDLSESQVKSFQRGEVPYRHFKGVMSAYPLLDDSGELRRLDGWLLHCIAGALRKRSALLVNGEGGIGLPVPHNLTSDELLRVEPVESTSSGRLIDLSVPSVRRIARVISRAADQYGPASVGADPAVGPSNPGLEPPQPGPDGAGRP